MKPTNFCTFDEYNSTNFAENPAFFSIQKCIYFLVSFRKKSVVGGKDKKRRTRSRAGQMETPLFDCQ